MGEASQLIPWKTLHQRHCNIGLLLHGCITPPFIPCQPPSNSPPSSTTNDGDGKRIYWTDVDTLPISSNTEQYEYVEELLGSGGSGVKMNDGTLVFPVEGIKS
ncbi:trans-sialidase, partial [Trypanosoma cruzi]